MKGPTPFSKLQDFRLLDSILPEYMHLVCLGMCRRLMDNTFHDGSKVRDVRCDPEDLNQLLSGVKVPSEFSSIRPVSAKWKAQEFRNTLLFMIPTVTK